VDERNTRNRVSLSRPPTSRLERLSHAKRGFKRELLRSGAWFYHAYIIIMCVGSRSETPWACPNLAKWYHTYQSCLTRSLPPSSSLLLSPNKPWRTQAVSKYVQQNGVATKRNGMARSTVVMRFKRPNTRRKPSQTTTSPGNLTTRRHGTGCLSCVSLLRCTTFLRRGGYFVILWGRRKQDVVLLGFSCRHASLPRASDMYFHVGKTPPKTEPSREHRTVASLHLYS